MQGRQELGKRPLGRVVIRLDVWQADGSGQWNRAKIARQAPKRFDITTATRVVDSDFASWLACEQQLLRALLARSDPVSLLIAGQVRSTTIRHIDQQAWQRMTGSAIEQSTPAVDVLCHHFDKE